MSRTTNATSEGSILRGMKKEECGPAFSQIMESTGEKEENVCENRWMAGMRKWFCIEKRKNDLVKGGLSETGSYRAIAGWLTFCIEYLLWNVETEEV